MKIEGVIVVSRQYKMNFFFNINLGFCLPTLIGLSILIHFSTKGFDEYMNVVLDDAHEVFVKSGTRKSVG